MNSTLLGRNRRPGGQARRVALGALPTAIAGALLTGLALTGSCLGAGATGAASTNRHLTLYAVPVSAQFMNHADDRVRGMTTNPFARNEQALVIIDKGTEKGNGPFPGDDVLYTFKLYPDATLGTSTGSALFTCYYTFIKHATCEAYFRLGSSVMVAAGQIVFQNERFVLAVNGGTHQYLGTRGQVTSAPAAKEAERLDFVLAG